MPFSPKLVRIARRLLAILAAFVTLIALAIVIEHWRGDRAWKKCLAEHTAKGDPLDVLPPELPALAASKNFFCTPELERVLAGKNPQFHIPAFFPKYRWDRGQFYDLRELAEELGKNKKVAASPTEDPIQLIRSVTKPFEPALEAVREGAAARPHTRHVRPEPITTANLFSARSIDLSETYNLSRYLVMDACLNRADGQIEKAYIDTLAGLKIARGLLESSYMILETMIGDAALSGALQPLWEGLQQHSWNDNQLIEFQKQIEACQLMPSLRRALVSERNAIASIDLREIARLSEKPMPFYETAIIHYWGQQNKVSHTRGINRYIDIIASQSTPEFLSKYAWLKTQRHRSISPYRIMEQLVQSNFSRIIIDAVERSNNGPFALTACALERHWLAHGSYPERLAELVPSYLDKVPLDIIDGQPLRYRRTDDGKFVLYSIGLDGKDDGGKPADPKQTDGPGDWAWPQPVNSVP